MVNTPVPSRPCFRSHPGDDHRTPRHWRLRPPKAPPDQISRLLQQKVRATRQNPKLRRRFGIRKAPHRKPEIGQVVNFKRANCYPTCPRTSRWPLRGRDEMHLRDGVSHPGFPPSVPVARVTRWSVCFPCTVRPPSTIQIGQLAAPSQLW